MNPARGRDHYPNAWSMMMTGCGLKRGVVVGRDGCRWRGSDGKPFNEQNLFATIFTRARASIPMRSMICPGCPTFHRVENRAEPIRELLA